MRQADPPPAATSQTSTTAQPAPANSTLRRACAASALVIGGTAASVAAVIAEGRQGPRDPRATDPTSWWGILPPVAPTGITRGTLAGTSALAVIVLCLCWLALVRHALTGRAGPRTVLAAVIAWGAPFALGPPLFSRDAYAYAAQGELARHGLDPATHGVWELADFAGGSAFMEAVDPRWRHTHTPYGGGAVAVEKLAAALAHLTGAGPVVALVTLRLVAVISVAVLVACTVRLVSSRAGTRPGDAGHGRAVALVLTAANPVTTIHLVGGMHLDALATAALAAALLADRHRDRDRLISAGALAATALVAFSGTIKATAFVMLGWFAVAHARDARARARDGGAGRWSAVALAVVVDLAVTVAVLVLSMAASGFGPTWVKALTTSGALTTGIAPASLLASLVAAFAGLAHVHLVTDSGSRLLAVCRDLTLGTAAVIVGVLLWRAWRRAVPAGDAEPDDRDGLVVLGVGGLAVALGSPVLYPWYLAPALPMLALLTAGWLPGRVAPASDPVAARRRRAALWAVLVPSVWLCLATMSPLAETWKLLAPDGPRGAAPLVWTLVIAAVLLVTGCVVLARAVRVTRVAR